MIAEAPWWFHGACYTTGCTTASKAIGHCIVASGTILLPAEPINSKPARRWDRNHLPALFVPQAPRQVGRERTLGVPRRRVGYRAKRG